MNWKLYYSRVHGQIHLAAQFTSGVLSRFQNAPGRLDFWCSKGKNWGPPPPPPPETPKLKVREVSQSGFWNISLYPPSVPSFSQIGWPQLLAPGTLSQTMTLKCLQVRSNHFWINRKSGTSFRLFPSTYISEFLRLLAHFSDNLAWQTVAKIALLELLCLAFLLGNFF